MPTSTTATAPSIDTASLPTPTSAREFLDRAAVAIRAQVRPLAEATRSTAIAVAGKVGRAVAAPLGRLGDLAERYVAAKIKRRVKPPILAALLIAGVAVVVAAFALARK